MILALGSMQWIRPTNFQLPGYLSVRYGRCVRRERDEISK